MIILATIALTMAISQSEPQETEQIDADQMCLEIGDLAEAIMTNRQLGIAMSRMMGAGPTDDAYAALFREMLVSAFETPRYDSPEFQVRESQDFRAQWELICYQEHLRSDNSDR